MVAGLSADRQYLNSTISFTNIKLRDIDGQFVQHGTRGDVGRAIICDQFLNSKHDALLLLDLDMEFQPDVLERLRVHSHDMVSGHYMKRTTRFLHSIWQYTVDGSWPYLPYVAPEIPLSGMHRLASTGMGCVLIRRKVIEAVKAFLPLGSNPFDIGLVPELSPMHGNFGSDYRFFYYAQKLGFELWGDADVDCPHASSIWVTRQTHKDIQPSLDKTAEYMMTHVWENTIRSRGVISLNALIARRTALEAALAKSKGEQKLVIEGQLAEVDIWMNDLKAKSPPTNAVRPWAEKLPADKPQFPAFRTEQELEYAMNNREVASNGSGAEEAADIRKDVRQREAVDAAKRLDLYNHLHTSTNKGTLDKLK